VRISGIGAAHTLIEIIGVVIEFEPAEFEEQPVEVQDSKNITHHLMRNLYMEYTQVGKETLKEEDDNMRSRWTRKTLGV
jgi:hypothetical protein